MEKNDEQILQQFQNETTKEAGFTALMKKYKQKMYWHIRKMVECHEDADDVVQNVFIKVWQHLDTFREDGKLCGWLYRIATNETMNFIHQKKRRYAISLDNIENYLSNHLVANQYFAGEEIVIKLQKAILVLPDKQRTVFNLRYYQEMPYEKMSLELETSVVL